jgi:23S rRNA (pseudouridine1915-N3)-methyltransferase
MASSSVNKPQAIRSSATAACDENPPAMKIHFVMLGKTRRAEPRVLLEDYVARIGHYAEVQVTELRDAATWRKKKFDAHSAVVLLDAAGKQFASAQFANWLGERRDSGLRELVFLCGDADGFPAELRDAARFKISLSSLTMPHELARVLLAEQIYRAFAILAGHPYPK